METKENKTEELIGLVVIYIFAFVAVFLSIFAFYFHFTTNLSIAWMIKLLLVDLGLMGLAIVKPILDLILAFWHDILKN